MYMRNQRYQWGRGGGEGGRIRENFTKKRVAYVTEKKRKIFQGER